MLPVDEAQIETLLFRVQSDGRKVSRLPGGKVVLVDLSEVDRVKDGEWWLVKLRHRETFSIATPIERVTMPAAHPTPLTHPMPLVSPAPTTVVIKPVPTPAPPRSRDVPLEVGGMLIEPENIIRATDRVAFFVDGANMDGACRQAGFFIDYKKARDYFLGLGTFYAGFYYVADFTATDPMQLRFLDFLSYNGFIIRRKPVKAITDTDTGETIYKGNLDTEIVLDMMDTLVNYDVAFLFSGDSDFVRAVDLLRSRGKRVYAVTSRRSVSRELAYTLDKPVFFIEDFKEILRREAPAERSTQLGA